MDRRIICGCQARPPKQPVPVATALAIAIPTPVGGDLDLSYWDIWYALLAHDQFNGELENLAQELRKMRQQMFYGDDANRKLSHLRNLQHRLANVAVDISAIVKALPPDMAKAEKRRAHGRILKHSQRSYELSDAMRILPKARFRDIALHGLWTPFPVSPQPYCETLRAAFNWRRCYEEDDSWGLARKLDAAATTARKLEQQGRLPEAFSAHRAILTVTLELMERADDSYGTIAQSFEFVFKNYLTLSRQPIGISVDGFFTDLLELLLFEGYSLTWRHTDGFFAAVKPEEGDFCLSYLRRRIHELTAWDLDHEVEQARGFTAQIVSEQKRWDSFVSVAGELGTQDWQSIVLLADTAVRARKRDLASLVFQAALADTQGSHFDFLSKKHAQLLKGQWSSDPRK